MLAAIIMFPGGDTENDNSHVDCNNEVTEANDNIE